VWRGGERGRGSEDSKTNIGDESEKIDTFFLPGGEKRGLSE